MAIILRVNLIRSFFIHSLRIVCWSPQGKQFVIAKCDGALELYEPNLVSKKTYPSIINNSSFPPCINVLWISTRQFLLNFSDNTPGEDSFVQILVTFDKVRSPIQSRSTKFHSIRINHVEQCSTVICSLTHLMHLRIPTVNIFMFD